jgi:hypothetical protein
MAITYEIEGLVPNQTNINGVTFTGSTGVTPVPSTITEDTLVVVTIATDPNPIFTFRGEESEYIIRMEEQSISLRSEEGVNYLPFLEMEWTNTFGETFTEPILIN